MQDFVRLLSEKKRLQPDPCENKEYISEEH